MHPNPCDRPLPEIKTVEQAEHLMRRCEELRKEGVMLSERTKQLEVICFKFLREAIKGDGFYKSPAWRSVRYQVLRERGRRCECCGCTPADGREVHVDHIVPRSKDPSLEINKGNLQVLCADCNLGKSNTDAIDWRDR